jgi:ribosomal protein S18 acetylase RimI-like enzyme
MAEESSIVIRQAEFPKDLYQVTVLFRAYANALNIDLSFQKFEEELASLPGKYSPLTGGALFLATLKLPYDATPGSALMTQENVIGCACLRALNPPGTCELKRLYLTKESRGLGLGRKLLQCSIEQAKALGYKEIVLDTLPEMIAARKMYRGAGFVDMEKYYDTPLEGTIFIKLTL